MRKIMRIVIPAIMVFIMCVVPARASAEEGVKGQAIPLTKEETMTKDEILDHYTGYAYFEYLRRDGRHALAIYDPTEIRIHVRSGRRPFWVYVYDPTNIPVVHWYWSDEAADNYDNSLITTGGGDMHSNLGAVGASNAQLDTLYTSTHNLYTYDSRDSDEVSEDDIYREGSIHTSTGRPSSGIGGEPDALEGLTGFFSSILSLLQDALYWLIHPIEGIRTLFIPSDMSSITDLFDEFREMITEKYGIIFEFPQRLIEFFRFSSGGIGYGRRYNNYGLDPEDIPFGDYATWGYYEEGQSLEQFTIPIMGENIQIFDLSMIGEWLPIIRGFSNIMVLGGALGFAYRRLTGEGGIFE